MKCFVINRIADAGRLQQFRRDWNAPFHPDIVDAIDGATCTPASWAHGAGTFGLFATYLSIFTRAMHATEPFAVFEDDALLMPDWPAYVAAAIAEAPRGWWTINLGADIEVPGWPTRPVAVSEHLARMPHGWRTHAVVYNPAALGELVLAMGANPIPVDQVWCALMLKGSENFYCTRTFLAGSRGGRSTISGIQWDNDFVGPLGLGGAQHRALA